MMERDVSHPCIVGWVPFNESELDSSYERTLYALGDRRPARLAGRNPARSPLSPPGAGELESSSALS